MATNGALQGMVPKTKRKGSELFLGHVQDPAPSLASSRQSTFSAWSAALTAPGANTSSHGPLQKRPPLPCLAWAGSARAQAPLLGPADNDVTGPTLSLLPCWGSRRQRAALRSLRREPLGACFLSPAHPTRGSVTLKGGNGCAKP